MGLLDNGGRELGQWPPFHLKHFHKKWNPVFRWKKLAPAKAGACSPKAGMDCAFPSENAVKSMQHCQESPGSRGER
jgi:hypothetical protein